MTEQTIEWTGEDNPHCCTPPNPLGCQGPTCEWYAFDALLPEEHAIWHEPLPEPDPITAEQFGAWWETFRRGLEPLWPKIADAMDAFARELARSGRVAVRVWAELWGEVERLERAERRDATRRAGARARLAAQCRQGYPGAVGLRVVRRRKPAHVRQRAYWAKLEVRAIWRPMWEQVY
jgi:hypothetical protein